MEIVVLSLQRTKARGAPPPSQYSAVPGTSPLPAPTPLPFVPVAAASGPLAYGDWAVLEPLLGPNVAPTTSTPKCVSIAGDPSGSPVLVELLGSFALFPAESPYNNR